MRTTLFLGTISSLIYLSASCGGQATSSLVDLPPVQVRIAQVQVEPVEQYLTVSGRVEAAQSANVSTRMMGHVETIHAQVGERVSKGQVLVSIQNSELQAQQARAAAAVRQAKAGFQNAANDYERFEALHEQGSASEKEWENVSTRYEVAQAALDAARNAQAEVQAQFAYAEVKAPFMGRITQTFVKAGDMASPGMPLVALEDAAKLEVTALVPESDIALVETGMPAKVQVRSVDKMLSGTVSERSTSARNTGGQYLVKIRLAESDSSVLAGMFANVQFRTGMANDQKEATVWVPKEALVDHGQLTGIYAVAGDSVALLRWLRTGRTVGDRVEIVAGLQPGESYILSAEGKLFNGARITR